MLNRRSFFGAVFGAFASLPVFASMLRKPRKFIGPPGGPYTEIPRDNRIKLVIDPAYRQDVTAYTFYRRRADGTFIQVGTGTIR